MPACCGDAEVALWRSATGKVAAWEDRCPHRGMRLSHGFVRGEMLSCIYHGWRYDQTGTCQKIPAHPGLEPPASIKVRSFTALEQDGVIWLSEGEMAEPPPPLTGLTPLRSVTVDAITVLDPVSEVDGMTLLVQPLPGGRTGLHALTASTDPGERKAASRRLEVLRRDLEAGVAA
ncbi:Rieske 2Fe-2S domain-containing protein [Pelagovum pacificum]|uniref:Rieske 2Fe-2S domain-containing protein n=2 Tax=Pelagovum pacificum TaxID=2588711 RepID=A0A5C5GCI7_9RHOB|nr:Rieske 2Fe-2S domain-containing protein [Pelagovum pacificum]